MRFLQRWLVLTLGILVANHLVRGVAYRSVGALLVASLLLGFCNAFVRPILVLLTFPILLITFGLFYFVINAGLLWAVGSLVRGFEVNGFWAAFWGGLVISLVGWIVNRLLGHPSDVQIRTARSDGKSRVIDV
ncbi:MAG: phage holin family protein [Pedosphaera sp.]|nr:phage holin family protein [Pedosphaera sp.]